MYYYLPVSNDVSAGPYYFKVPPETKVNIIIVS